jgi:hypothetical protein
MNRWFVFCPDLLGRFDLGEPERVATPCTGQSNMAIRTRRELAGRFASIQ